MTKIRKLIEHFDKVSLGLTAGVYNEDELSYLYARVQETRAKMCEIFATMALGFDVLLFFMRDAFPSQTALWWICNHSYGLAAIWLMLLYSAKTSERKQYWQTLGSAVTSALCSWIIYDLLTGATHAYRVDVAFSLSYAIVVGSFVILMSWVSRPLIACVVLVSLVFSWLLPDWHPGAPNRYISCLFIMFLPILNHALHLRLLRTEIREMRVRLSTMPRRMALSLVAEDQTPRERFCICLSSDWREYQDLVSGLSDEKVVLLLEDYYQRVQELMGSELLEYDYYMDWIADELFAVIYSTETDAVDLHARQNMAKCVVELAQKILMMKDKFSQDQNLNLGIDIGLSSGQSLIGVIGPTNYRKATALGSTPGRARRMQSCGKLLRKEMGEGDRVVFGDEMLIVLQAPNPCDLVIDRFDASKRRLRNLDDQALFFVQAARLNSALEEEKANQAS